MANLLLKIKEEFNNKKVEELFSFFHLGKEKAKGVKIYINDVLISQTDRGSLEKDLYYTGIRYSTGSFGAISFRNLSLTGHN